MSIYLEIYGHTLNPTYNRDAWPKSDQGPMLPPKTMNKKKGRKILLRKRELGEEVNG